MKPKLLLVDDEPNILLALEILLEREGYEVRKAYDGKQALAQLPGFKPDVVILDVMMPQLDGFEVAKQIRANPDYDELRIIFLTARGTDSDKLQGYNRGGEMYIVKPFDNEELVTKVRELVDFG